MAGIIEYLDKLITPDKSIDADARKPIKALSIGLIFASASSVVYTIILASVGSPLKYMSISYALIALFLVYRLKKFGAVKEVTFIFTAQLISIMLACIYQFGWDWGFEYLLLCSFSYAFLPRYKTLWFPLFICLSCLAAYFVAYYWVRHLSGPPIDYSPHLQNVIHNMNITVAAAVFGFLAMVYGRETFLAEKQVKDEKEKSEGLLHNILPIPIANRLKENPKIIADGFESVSVMFADIVGFTRLSSVLSPSELVNYLNTIFSHFDELAAKYEMEKIKTIGDAYMVSGGLPSHTAGHLERMADMALEMIEYVEAHQYHGDVEKLQIRIGFHTGPVVAGVIGVKKFAYDLWGDTVNIASRMESHGEPGKVNVTETVKDQLEDKFIFDDRREVDVKGKGLMRTYALISRKQ